MKNIIIILVSFIFFTNLAIAQTDPNTKINLKLVSPETTISVGETFEIPVVVHTSDAQQRYVNADVVFEWDIEKLEFIGISHANCHPLIATQYSGLPYCPPGQVNGCGDFYGLNETIPPTDGNGLYYSYSNLGSNLVVDQTETQIVKFIFKAINNFDFTEIKILPQYTVNYTATTVIYGSSIPGLSVTGTLTNAIITGTQLTGDFNQDGVVGSDDMALLLSNWGLTSFKNNPYDLDCDGVIGAGDLTILISNWQ